MSTAAFIALGLAGCHLSLGAHTHVDLAVEHGLSMLQRQVSPVSRLKPWSLGRTSGPTMTAKDERMATE